MFVFGMFIWTIIGILSPNYDRDLTKFLKNAIAQSNVLLILMLFVLAIVLAMLSHLYYLLKPYTVQMEHENWLDKMILKLECMSSLIVHLILAVICCGVVHVEYSRSYKLLQQ